LFLYLYSYFIMQDEAGQTEEKFDDQKTEMETVVVE
jgi:hypothetical protein